MAGGKRIPYSNGRRLVDDVIRVARKQPMAAYIRDMDLKKLHDLRRKIRPRLSWNAIMMKAYAMVSKENELVRQCYVGFPWPHIYQAKDTVAMITVSRQFQGEERLLFGRFNRPEEMSLIAIQNLWDHYNEAPVESIKQFRHQIRFAKCPTFFRRFVWWAMTNLVPSKRASHVGTFGMSFSGFNNAVGTAHLGPNTTILGVDLAPRGGQAKVLFTFDHSIFDGKPAVDALDALFKTLHGPVLEELKQLADQNQLESTNSDPTTVIKNQSAA